MATKEIEVIKGLKEIIDSQPMGSIKKDGVDVRFSTLYSEAERLINSTKRLQIRIEPFASGGYGLSIYYDGEIDWTAPFPSVESVQKFLAGFNLLNSS